jgi:hypothetical protein
VKQSIIASIIFMSYAHDLYSQSPTTKINYQGVARGGGGSPISAKSIRLKLDVTDSSGTKIHYSETHLTNTSPQGVFSVQIGGGLAETGRYENIPWSKGRTYLRSSVDTTGGRNFMLIGTSEFATVPYALYSLYGTTDTSNVQIPSKMLIIKSSGEKLGFGIGYKALDKMDASVINADNMAIGSHAGANLIPTQSIYNSSNNLLVGIHAGGGIGSQSAGQASDNVMIGNYAGQYMNQNAAGNVIVGIGSSRFAAGTYNGRSNFGSNVAVGINSLSGAADATYNISIGTRNMLISKGVNRNVSIGANASLRYNGDDNVLIGDGTTDDSLSKGNRNVIIGSAAAKRFIGDESILIGFHAGDGAYLTNPASPHGLVAIGSYAGSKTLIGANTFVGNQAGIVNTTGSDNTFIGQITGGKNTTGSYNSFLGMFAGLQNRTGTNNDYFGTRAGSNQTTGSSNAIFGNFSGDIDSSGNFNGNSIFGVHAGRNVKNGFNVIMGHNAAGLAVLGSRNIIIGANAGPSGSATQTIQNDRLMVDVEQTNTPLIYGEFDNNKLVVNGDLTVTGKVSGLSTKKIRYGSNVNSNLILEDDVEVYFSDEGQWNPSINLPVPSATNQNLLNRTGSTLLVTCKSSLSVTIKKTNTDLINDLQLNTNEYALFMYDATMWRKIAGK